MSYQAVLIPKWSPIRQSFWQKDSLITHILFELCLFRISAQCSIFLLTLWIYYFWRAAEWFRFSCRTFTSVINFELCQKVVFFFLYWQMSISTDTLGRFQIHQTILEHSFQVLINDLQTLIVCAQDRLIQIFWHQVSC